MPSLKHTHTYERFRKGFYHCIHPDCSHFLRKELLKNKRNLCVCGTEFILDSKQLQLKRPHCKDCTRSKKIKPEIDVIEAVLAGAPNRELAELFAKKDED